MRPRLPRPEQVLPLLAVLAIGVLGATPVQAQFDSERLWRFGVTFGSTSLIGISVERVWDSRSVDLSVGTFGFRDVGVSVVGRQYVGGRTVRGSVGLGLWTAVAAQPEGTGAGLILRAPLAVEVEAIDDHSPGLELSLSRALAIRRADPANDRPARTSIIPLPGFYWKFGR